MPVKKAPISTTTKTGVAVETSYCRRCMKNLPAKDFYDCVDEGFVDKNGLISVCKTCIQTIYDEVFSETQSFEKAIHKVCISLNIKFSNDALSATKTHINTLLENNKNVNAIFGIYKQKLLSTQKSMEKTSLMNMTYEDAGVIFTSETALDVNSPPIPDEVRDFWEGIADPTSSNNITDNEIRYLEKEYSNFKKTHVADTYAQIILLKQVCYTILTIEKLRSNNDDTTDLVKELQSLMKTLTISPNAAKSTASGEEELESFGLWIRDIEREEPAQWLKTDPRGDMYRDVGNVEEYFQKYLVRPLKNFITNSKDFNVDDNDLDADSPFDDEPENDFITFADEEEV